MIYIYKYNQIEIYPLRTVAKLECGSTLKKCFFTKMRSFLLSSDLCVVVLEKDALFKGVNDNARVNTNSIT